MIKELFLAIALGALFGFGITGGFLTFKKSQQSTPRQQIEKKSEINPTITEQTNATKNEISPSPLQQKSTTGDIVINTPEDNSIVSSAKIEIQGSTAANNIVVVNTPIKSYNAIADNQGIFKINADIESGANTIRITSVNPETDETSETSVLVTYSTAKF